MQHLWGIRLVMCTSVTPVCPVERGIEPCSAIATSAAFQVLALELLKVLLENSGEVFQGSEKFTGAIKQYLCLSLLKNAASNISAAQTLTCSIFYTLLVKFRHALKAEVGVFFPMILLKAIEPPTPNTASTPACESLLYPPLNHNAQGAGQQLSLAQHACILTHEVWKALDT